MPALPLSTLTPTLTPRNTTGWPLDLLNNLYQNQDIRPLVPLPKSRPSWYNWFKNVEPLPPHKSDIVILASFLSVGAALIAGIWWVTWVNWKLDRRDPGRKVGFRRDRDRGGEVTMVDGNREERMVGAKEGGDGAEGKGVVQYAKWVYGGGGAGGV